MSENTPEQSTQPISDEQSQSPSQEPGQQPAGQQAGAIEQSTQDATKPVEQWATGGEPATGPQLSYLQTLAREAGEDVPESLTKADASVLIDRLQNASPRVE